MPTAEPTLSEPAAISPDSGAIDQSPTKAVTTFELEQEQDELVLRIKYPKLPAGSHANQEAVRELYTWWIRAAASEAGGLVAKAVEYGSRDLFVLGRTMAETMHLDMRAASRADFEGLGIYFFMASKLGRWESAIQDGRQVSDDTLLDLGVYVRMYQRARQFGGWPGVSL